MEGKKFISHQEWSPIPRIPVHFTRHQSPLYIGPSHRNLTAVPVTHLSPSGHFSDRRMQTVTHTNVHEWRRKGERKKIRSAFNSPLHTNPFWEDEMYSGQKKKCARRESRTWCWIVAMLNGCYGILSHSSGAIIHRKKGALFVFLRRLIRQQHE